ncbi:hypothetical protein OH77DRAFT_1440494 [Trametes cingulata]|nr:hypothetical protein OH77DRAFT_1440494 [Trametes cingulata]
MREVPCLWGGCGAVLNSMSTLQKHVVLHAGDNTDWGTRACQWQSCSHRLSDEAELAHHLRKHAQVPFFCAYEGCDKSFNTPEAFLAHHKSSMHRNGQLRRTPWPFVPDISRELSPLPEVLPAYMSVPRRIVPHPMSKERHQWLGRKVIENITAFQYRGGGSMADKPARSLRLAEMDPAAMLAGVTHEAALGQIKRWIDGRYLAFVNGYDASRKPALQCPEIPSQEVTQMVYAGLVLWHREDDDEKKKKATPAAEGRTRPQESGEGPGPGGQEDERASAGADKDAARELEKSSQNGPPFPPAAAPSSPQNTSGADLAGPSHSADCGDVSAAVFASAATNASEDGTSVGQLSEDFMQSTPAYAGQGSLQPHQDADGHGRMSVAVMSASDARDGDATGRHRQLKLSRRSSVSTAAASGGPLTTD